MPPNSQNAPSAPKTRNRSEKVLVTRNVQAQLKAVAREAAVPLILAKNNVLSRLVGLISHSHDFPIKYCILIIYLAKFRPSLTKESVRNQ